MAGKGRLAPQSPLPTPPLCPARGPPPLNTPPPPSARRGFPSPEPCRASPRKGAPTTHPARKPSTPRALPPGSCAADGTWYITGRNDKGQLGTGDYEHRCLPQKLLGKVRMPANGIQADTPVTHVALGREHSAFVLGMPRAGPRSPLVSVSSPHPPPFPIISASSANHRRTVSSPRGCGIPYLCISAPSSPHPPPPPPVMPRSSQHVPLGSGRMALPAVL